MPLPRDLPMLPAPRVRALMVLWNPDATLDHFMAVVQSDPALTAAMLRAANSAVSASIRRVTRAQDAIVRLGHEQTRRIISAAIARSQFDDIEASWIDAREMWRHVLAVALLAEAGTETPEDRASAFSAGLLHDLGRLSLATTNPGRYARVIEMVRAGADVMAAEREALGVTHQSWGERVAQRWALPEAITEAVARHHDVKAPGVGGLIAQAREISWALGIGDGVSSPELTLPDLEDDLPAPLRVLGGADGLHERIGWYREAFEG